MHATISSVGLARLRTLADRLRVVHGKLEMTGLLTSRGKAPLSPIGYAMLIPEFQRAGLRWNDRWNRELVIEYSSARYTLPGHEHGLTGWKAVAAFFELEENEALMLFAPTNYRAAWTKGSDGVPVADIVERLDEWLRGLAD